MRAISDIHLSPGEEYEGDLHGPLILNGDIFNILPHGIQQWRTAEGMRTVNSLTDCLDDDAVFVLGNHEGRLAWLQELVPDFKVVRSIDIDGAHFEHGHRFASDWNLLRHMAPDFTEWMVTNPLTRKWWYRFCQWRGWMATGNQEHSTKYEPFVYGVWAAAEKEAHRLNKRLVIGHTHHPMQNEWILDLGANEVMEV